MATASRNRWKEENGGYALGMDYSRIVPLLVESVKLLKQDNAELREMLLKALAEIERIKTGK